MSSAIKIIEGNRGAIEAWLKTANDRARTHVMTTYDQVARAAERAEHELETFGVTKAARAGARAVTQSGDKLPNAYKHKAIATQITIERRSSAWYLVQVTTYMTCGRATTLNAVSSISRKRKLPRPRGVYCRPSF